MTTLQLSIVCFTALALASIAATVLVHRVERARDLRGEDQAPSRVRHRVTVHTKQPDDQTLFGVVVGDYTDRLVLEDAEYVTPTGGRPIPGRQDIATKDIAWIDVHDQVAPVPSHAPVPAPAEVS